MTQVDRSRLPGLGPEPTFRFPAVQKTTVSTGLAVWSVEHRSLPIVTFLLLIPAGSAADPPTRPGLAALAADLLDEGAGDRSMLQIHDAIARMGAQFDLEVLPDATVLSLTTLSRFMQPGLTLIGDLVSRPWLADVDLTRVRDLRLARLMQLRDQPAAVADRVFLETLYPDHPYGHLGIGTEASLRSLTSADVRTFHTQHHDPSGSVLVVVGDASHGQAVRAAEEALGGWRRDQLRTAPPPPSRPDPSGRRLVLAHRSGAPQSELRIGHVSAPRATPDYYALLVLNMILGGQFVSRINQKLREEKGYTYGARTWFDFRRGAGPFTVQTSVQTDATAEAIADVAAEIAAIRAERPPTAAEIQAAQAALTRGYPRGFETCQQIARGAAQMALYDLPEDYFDRFASEVAAVEGQAIRHAAFQHLDPSRFVTVVVGDRDQVGGPLAALELGEAVEAPA